VLFSLKGLKYWSCETFFLSTIFPFFQVKFIYYFGCEKQKHWSLLAISCITFICLLSYAKFTFQTDACHIVSAMKQMGLLRMRAAINLPIQTEQRRCFWWGHDTVGNEPLNYIVSDMKQMGLLLMRTAIRCPVQTEQRRFFWWGHDTVGNKPLNYIGSILKHMGLLRMRAAIICPAQTEKRRCFWCGTQYDMYCTVYTFQLWLVVLSYS
jgi:hypothetical protein